MTESEILRELENIKQQTRDLGTFISLEKLITKISVEDSNKNSNKLDK